MEMLRWELKQATGSVLADSKIISVLSTDDSVLA